MRRMGIFKDSRMAHRYLDRLNGIEIGGSAHNPFNIAGCRNVDYTADLTTVFKKEEIRLCGRVLPVDIVASGDELPFPDESLDFVLSSHVIEHFRNPLRALREWHRVIRPGGYIFVICPHKERTFDKSRARTSLQELIERDTRQEHGPDLHAHATVWITADLLEACRHLGFRVIEYRDVDDKVGNGFTVVVRK